MEIDLYKVSQTQDEPLEDQSSLSPLMTPDLAHPPAPHSPVARINFNATSQGGVATGAYRPWHMCKHQPFHLLHPMCTSHTVAVGWKVVGSLPQVGSWNYPREEQYRSWNVGGKYLFSASSPHVGVTPLNGANMFIQLVAHGEVSQHFPIAPLPTMHLNTMSHHQVYPQSIEENAIMQPTSFSTQALMHRNHVTMPQHNHNVSSNTIITPNCMPRCRSIEPGDKINIKWSLCAY